MDQKEREYWARLDVLAMCYILWELYIAIG